MVVEPPQPLSRGNPDTVCFDFDGVLAESVWPDRGIGADIPEGIQLLNHYASLGYTIIIQSARREVDKALIWEWVRRRRLPVDGVSCGQKVSAVLYIDDRAWRFEREQG